MRRDRLGVGLRRSGRSAVGPRRCGRRRELDAVRDDLGAEPAIPVAVGEVAGAEPTLDVDSAALDGELLGHLGGAAEQDDPVVLGRLLPLTVRRSAETDMFGSYLAVFERIWQAGAPP